MVPWTCLSQSRKRHLDRSSRFCALHQCDQHTDTQTTLRVISVAIGRIYAVCMQFGITTVANGLSGATLNVKSQ